MKHRYLALILGLTLALTSLPAYASEETASTELTTEAFQELPQDMGNNPMEQMENAIRGQVVSVQDDSITITTEENEEQTITVTEDTVISRMSMGMGMGGNMGGGMDGQAPEKPEGDAANGDVPEKPEGDAENGDVPEKPEGDAANGDVPEMPDGQAPDGMKPSSETLALSDIQADDTVMITLADDGSAASITVMSMDGMAGMEAPDGMGQAPGGMGQSGAPESYDAVNTYSEDTESDGETFSSTGTDENALLVNGGASVSLQNASIDRTSTDSTGSDNSSFYGIGAAALATDGTLSISDSTITTDAAGGAGVFAYGSGTAYVADTSITTQQDTSGGIHVAGGGTLYAWDLNVETNGESAAAIRSDRGSGTMVVDGGTYISNGVGSPAVYSTADISIHNADLTATGSEAVCIEGLNSIRLYDCDLSGNMADNEQNDCTWTAIIYQSMSGDSEVGNSTFQMTGGTLTSGNGGLLYTTNTECTLTLQDVDITCSEDSDFFLRCTGNANQRGWGQTGSNGSDCLFTAINQEMSGDIIWDSISNLDFYMMDGSSLTGAFADDETYAGNGGNGYCNVYLDASSIWTVTGDSRISSLYAESAILDENGNTVSITGTDGTTYVEGTSDYTITVDSYSDSVDLSGATVPTEWESCAAERPENL